MKKTAEIDKPIKFGCEFCKREFIKESTVLKHICEYKHRWTERDKQSSRIGFQAWLQFYKKNSVSKKNRTFEEFIKSAYYIAFVKFGAYCVGINAINISRYIDWLLRDQIKIDNWCQDSVYSKFLCDYLRTENSLDAIARSIETTIQVASDERLQSHDYIRYGNVNKICYAVTTGKISPWMLYMSESGVKFLSDLSADRVKMIGDYINMEQWAIKFKREPEVVKQVKELLDAAGY
jgi:hypothetical protein